MKRIHCYFLGLTLTSQLSYVQPDDFKKRGLVGFDFIKNKNKKNDCRSVCNQDTFSANKQNERVRKQAVLNLVLNVQYLPEEDEYTTDISYRKSSRSSKAPTLDSFLSLQNLFASKEVLSAKPAEKPTMHHCIYKDALDNQMSNYFNKPK